VIARSELPDAEPPQSHAAAPRDVFVSYARVDLPFVRSLCERLDAAEVRPWVDVEGLFAGEEFWPEVCKAIDTAPAFVFVMTPHSVSSGFCLRELSHARASQKRIVPVCRREAPVDALPPELASRQWVFFRDYDDADRATRDLVGAIRADWAWLRQHARLLVRAGEWQARHQDPAATLRGRELVEAERWLNDPHGEDIGVTTLHRAFISASRAAQRRRRARLAAVAATAAATLLVTAWIALTSTIAGRVERADGLLAQGQAEAALANVAPAVRWCALLPVTIDGCIDAAMATSDALVQQARYDAAMEPLSAVIRDAERWAADDIDAQDRRALAYQKRAIAAMRQAEELDAPVDARSRAYAAARDDIDRATRIRTKVQGIDDPPIAMTRARWLIGTGAP